MPDPSAHRPEDWDLRKSVPDEDAVKPAAWLENEPTTIPNPGVWGNVWRVCGGGGEGGGRGMEVQLSKFGTL